MKSAHQLGSDAPNQITVLAFFDIDPHYGTFFHGDGCIHGGWNPEYARDELIDVRAMSNDHHHFTFAMYP